ncbi:MAG: TonB-dependent receptor [Mucilaginibacter sp.]
MSLACALYAGKKDINGMVTDSLTNMPIHGATVTISPTNRIAVTNEVGRFVFKNCISTSVNTLTVSAVGYEKRTFKLTDLNKGQMIALNPHQTQLADVVVRADAGNPYKAISETDIKMRGVSNAQEVLRIVPGLFIGQHQGGGKAEQMFLRGFDADHGTDVSLNVDGIPINMVSHAHGQGYADSHFIIPETIESTNFKKGPYDAGKGDLATAGSVDFHTADAISNNTVKLEGGQFNTFRALAMVNILSDKAKVNGQSWYAASEYRYSDSYFDNPQHFQRFNFFTKYKGKLSAHNALIISASAFYSSWFASGQIPDQAIDKGLVGFYGALDPNEGGVTSRTTINAQLLTTLGNNDIIKNQVYYTRYKFDLHTNFTFFLVDTLNGDEIRQRESRNLYGYNGSYIHESYWGNTKLTTNIGANARLDATSNSELDHTKDRYITINQIKLGDITELSIAPYISETFRLNEKLTINAGLRFDQLFYRYNNKLAGDTTLHGIGVYKATNHTISPKVNMYYQASDKTEIYLSTGKGFHSNDTRAVVAVGGVQTLPSAYGTDLGIVFKPADNLLVNAAAWYIYLQKEYVYGGDGGTVDFSGRTQRLGFDFSARYEPIRSIFIDLDINYAHGRSLDDPAGQNYIPLAPVLSSTAGITYINKSGFNGSLRYRYLGDRPANRDYSLKAQGYFVNDMVLNYTERKYEIGIALTNLFDIKWKETIFDTVTRLKHETAPVDGIAFTPGTKFAAILHLSYFF